MIRVLDCPACEGVGMIRTDPATERVCDGCDGMGEIIDLSFVDVGPDDPDDEPTADGGLDYPEPPLIVDDPEPREPMSPEARETLRKWFEGQGLPEPTPLRWHDEDLATRLLRDLSDLERGTIREGDDLTARRAFGDVIRRMQTFEPGSPVPDGRREVDVEGVGPVRVKVDDEPKTITARDRAIRAMLTAIAFVALVLAALAFVRALATPDPWVYRGGCFYTDAGC